MDGWIWWCRSVIQFVLKNETDFSWLRPCQTAVIPIQDQGPNLDAQGRLEWRSGWLVLFPSLSAEDRSESKPKYCVIGHSYLGHSIPVEGLTRQDQQIGIGIDSFLLGERLGQQTGGLSEDGAASLRRAGSGGPAAPLRLSVTSMIGPYSGGGPWPEKISEWKNWPIGRCAVDRKGMDPLFYQK